MKRIITPFGVVTALALASWLGQSGPLLGAETPVEATKVKKVRVYVPYSKLQLEEPQRQQIGEIQMSTRAKIKQLQEEEEKQIRALLKPDQIEALKQMEEAAKQKRREYYKKYRAKKQAEQEAQETEAEK